MEEKRREIEEKYCRREIEMKKMKRNRNEIQKK